MQQVDDFEEEYDYVFLSDFENEASPECSREQGARGSTSNGKKRVSIGGTHIITSRQGQETSFRQRQRTPDSQRSESESDLGDDSENHHSNKDNIRNELDESDGEEIEYGYETDLLVIMPAMLKDYSHHATNYHPELWRPSPGSGAGSQHASSARCRQEGPHQQQQRDQDDETSNTAPSRVQFARIFTEGLAKSFLRPSIDYSQRQEEQLPTNGNSDTASTSNPNQTSIATKVIAPTITPSMSSKELGVILPCDHGLCLSCLQTFLINATQNPQARFPTACPQPGCRIPIPTECAELVLDSETLEIWYRKLAEIHVANKVCCPLPECQSIVDLDDRDGTAVTCPECRNSFCASCAVPYHRGMTCEQYRDQAQGGQTEEDRAMLQLVQDRHWRHCPSCRFVIEKQQGCNHMVCHCGQSFCYACGHPWNEMDARCSRDCENGGIQDDMAIDCIIM
ncbi:hypothetical protein FBU30_008610 [Linnemannia zychae]|nr:hypothetical protein FBU30_008610 [Linnemannia zychae]